MRRRITGFGQRRLFSAAALAIVLLVSRVYAQDGMPTPEPAATLQPSITQTVRLPAGEVINLLYSGTAGDVITVVARTAWDAGSTETPPLDTVLEVLTPEGRRLAYNDDHAGSMPALASTDSLIRDLRLLTTGNYLIRLSSYNGRQGGEVEVTLTRTTPSAQSIIVPTPAQPTTTEVFSGEISPHSEARFPIQGTFGELITVTVRAVDDSFDPQLTLLDSSGVGLAQNNDNAAQTPDLGRYDAQIVNFPILASEPLQARVTGYNGTGGAFTVTVDHAQTAGANPMPTGVPNPVQGTLAATLIATYSEAVILGAFVNPGGDIYRYSIPGNAGDVYTIIAHATTPELNPRIAVYHEDDTLIIVNEDHGTSDPSLNFLDAKISNLILPRSGWYEVQISGYNRTGGPFDLIVIRTGQGAPLTPSVEMTYTGAVDSDDYWQQPVALQDGDYVTITIRAASEDFDPQLALLSPGGVISADNDDHGTNAADLGFLDSRMTNFLVEEDGIYTIQVNEYQGRSGEFTVTVEIRR